MVKAEYVPIPADGDHSLDDEPSNDTFAYSGRSAVEKTVIRHPRIVLGILTISVLLNIFFSGAGVLYLYPSKTANTSLVGLASQPLVARKDGYWSPEWDVMTAAEADLDALWEAPDTNFGIVALDKKEASSHGLSPGMPWTPDESKQVYILPAYHSLHCVRWLRIVHKQLQEGRTPIDWWKEHALHCFEVVREELMCRANDDIFPVVANEPGKSGVRRFGDGEVRECSNWEYLRDWAGKNSAGFVGPQDTKLTQAVFSVPGPETDGWYISSAETA